MKRRDWHRFRAFCAVEKTDAAAAAAAVAAGLGGVARGAAEDSWIWSSGSDPRSNALLRFIIISLLMLQLHLDGHETKRVTTAMV